VFTAGATSGNYFVYAEADVDGVVLKDSVAVEVQELELSIAISPAAATVLTEGTILYSAIVEDQFGNAIATQPTFTWSVSDGGTIGTDGLFTADTVPGDYQVYAEATVSSELLKDSTTVTVTNDPGDCLVTFENPLDAAWDTLINCEDASGSVYIDEANDKLILDASSGTCNTFFDRDFFNGIQTSPISGDFEVSAKVTVNTAKSWTTGSRGGIIIGRNISSGAGVASVAIRPQSSEYRMYYDSDGDALMDAWDNPGSGLHSNTSWLKITRQGNVVSTYYKNDGDASWSMIGSHDIGFGNDDMDIVLAAGDLELHIDSVYMSTCPLVSGGSTKQDQTITFDTIADKLISDGPFTLNATASSGLDVTFTVISGPATVSGNEITLTGSTGIVEVEARQSGDATYNAASPVMQTFMVSLTTNINLSHSKQNKVTIAPNPADEYVFVKVKEEMIDKIELYTIDGMLLHTYSVSSDNVKIDNTATFIQGMYLLRVYKKSGGVSVHRLMIRH
jgi:hypothetical protein